MGKNKLTGLAAGLILCFLLALNTSAAGEVLELKIADAVALALENNLAFKAATLDWQAAKAALERAELVGEEEMLKEAAKKWEKEDAAYEERRVNLINQIRNSYRGVLEEEAALKNRLAAKERARRQLEIDERKFEAGLLSSLDIKRAENSLANAEHNYQTAVINLATMYMEFNQLLGLELTTKLALTEQFDFTFKPFPIELQEYYELALESDKDVAGARENLKEAAEKVLAAQGPFTPRVELEEALLLEQKAQIQVEKAKQALYLKVRKDYYNLQNLAHAVTGAEKEIEFQKQILQAEESKYAAGVISNAQIVAQQEKVAAAEEAYSDALLKYSLSRNNLLQAVGLDDDLKEAPK
ncbi:MAG TPA: TolC family protein [Firmicutes bacterium]|nr:TolC family protein [Bacillota bacterium]